METNTDDLRVSHAAFISPNESKSHITALHTFGDLNPLSEDRNLQMDSVRLRLNIYITAQTHHQWRLENAALP